MGDLKKLCFKKNSNCSYLASSIGKTSCNTKMRFTKSKSRGRRRVVAGLCFCHHRFPTVAKAFKANKGQVEAIKMKDSSHKARIIHWGGINLI